MKKEEEEDVKRLLALLKTSQFLKKLKAYQSHLISEDTLNYN